MTSFAQDPLDAADQAVLDAVAAMWATADPPPAGLDDRVVFALDLTDVDAEVARLSDEATAGSGARSGERTRTITFDAASRTVMVTAVDLPGGLLRLDGWLAPPAACDVELRQAGATRTVTADDAGRFVFAEVPSGLAQLHVHPPSGSAAPDVVTPSFDL